MTDDAEDAGLTEERADGVVHLTIDGTGPVNALPPDLIGALHATAARLAEDDAVQAITLTGAGDAFCAGADLGTWNGDPSDAPAVRRLAATLHDAVLAFHAAETPLITAVNGVAAGAGFSLAILGDVLLASDAARFDYAYHRIGLTGDGGSTFLLPRLVGLRRAREIALLGEPIGPDRAVELGLATEVVPAADLDGRRDALTAEVAAGPTWALGRTRRLMTESFDRDLAGQLAAETDAMVAATRTEDFARGHAAFFAKETPEFVGE